MATFQSHLLASTVIECRKHRRNVRMISLRFRKHDYFYGIYYLYFRCKHFIVQLVEHKHNTARPEIICPIMDNKLSPHEFIFFHIELHTLKNLKNAMYQFFISHKILLRELAELLFKLY